VKSGWSGEDDVPISILGAAQQGQTKVSCFSMRTAPVRVPPVITELLVFTSVLAIVAFSIYRAVKAHDPYDRVESIGLAIALSRFLIVTFALVVFRGAARTPEVGRFPSPSAMHS